MGLAVVCAAIPPCLVEAGKTVSRFYPAGINAIRTAHYPFAPKFYEIADTLGFWIINEIPIATRGVGAARRDGFHPFGDFAYLADFARGFQVSFFGLTRG